jgi:protein phosphatase
MGTTCTALALTPHGALIGHVGDSRCYRIRRDRIDQLTFDHSLQWEMQRQNRKLAANVDLAGHRNIITRSLGPEPSVEIDLEGPFMILPGDIFVLCSDGLTGELTDEEIGAIANELSPAQACRLLVHLANIRGGGDNCTVTVIRIGDLPANVAPPELPPPIPQYESLSWSWLGVGWASALFLVIGILMMSFSRYVPGGIMVAIAVAGFALLTRAFVTRRRNAPLQNEDLSRTNYWRPHRTALLKPTQVLFDDMSVMEGEISRAAKEEGWNVNWTQHAAALQAASEAKSERRFGRGIRDLSRAIDLLMTPMYAARRNSGSAAAK